MPALRAGVARCALLVVARNGETLRDESFDVGFDTLTGVNDADYQPPFALTAKLENLTIEIDRPQLSPADIARLEAAMQEKAKRD